MLSKLLYREIKGSFGRFAAIFAIIALGVGFFSGLKVCQSAMLETGNSYISGHSLFYYRAVSTLGFTEEDVRAFSELDGVLAADGSMFADFIFTSEAGEDEVLKAQSLTEDVNTLSLLAGRLPEKANECVADGNKFSQEDIGKTINLSKSNDSETMDTFAYDEYVIVGIVDSVYYLNFERGTTTKGNGTVSGFIYLPYEGFSVDYYAEIFLTLDQTGFIYSDEYDNAVDGMETPVTTLANSLADSRYNQIVSDAKGKLSDAQAEYDDGARAYEEGKTEYEDGMAQLDSATEEYETQKADTEQQLTTAAAELQSLESTLSSGRAALEKSREDLAAGRAQVEAGYEALEENRTTASEQLAALDAQEEQLTSQIELLKAQLSAIEGLGLTDQEQELQRGIDEAEAGLASLQSAEDQITENLADAQKQLDGQMAAIVSGELQADESEKQLDELETQIESGWDEYNASKEAAEEGFAEAETELAEKKAELEDASAELEDAKAKLDSGAKELEDAKAEIDAIEYPSVYILDRYTNTGYVCFKSDSSIVEGIAEVFPLFFFLVAALICVTTMNRMVDEQRTQIGVLKALGYSERSIMYKYLMYSGVASLLGCITGFYAGSYVFPKVIWQAYNIMYGFADITFVLDYKLGAIVTAAYLACVLGVTFSSCKTELLSAPAELIRPKTPKSGKRVFLERVPFIWKHMSFLYKVSARNLFRYKKRLVMMVLGIAGCTALLVTGFGLNDSISHLVDFQYDEIMVYDCALNFKDGLSESAREELNTSLADQASGILYLHESSADAEAGNITKSVTLMSVGAEELSGFVDLHNGGEELGTPGIGEAYINNGLADKLGVSAGDTLTVRNGDLETLELTVTGVFDNYVYNYVIVSDETCAEQWGSVPERNTAFVNIADGVDVHEAAAKIMENSRVGSVLVSQDTRERIGNMMDSLKYIVLLVIFCAGALAFIVIFNLTSINITERMREIATIKVLGFYAGETASYVYRENTVMTAVGALIGLGLGKLLHAYVMSQIRIDMVSFDARVAGMSYLYSVLLTFAFAAVVNIAMYFRIEKINMAESLKSIE